MTIATDWSKFTGARVTATELCDPDEQDHQPRTVTGVLEVVQVPVFHATHYWVGDVPVDPETIKVEKGWETVERDSAGRWTSGGDSGEGAAPASAAAASEATRAAQEALWGRFVDPSNEMVAERLKGEVSQKIDDALTFDKRFDPLVEQLGNGDRELAVRKLVSGWADTSGDSQPAAIAMQLAAEHEFGVDGAVHPWTAPSDDPTRPTGESLEAAARALADDAPGGREAFLRAMYDETQADLRDKGVAGMWLYRGSWSAHWPDDMSGRAVPMDVRQEGRTVFQPMSSFTLAPGVAQAFAKSGPQGSYSRVDAMWVPSERILSYAGTGYGSLDEREVVVLGGTADVASVAHDPRSQWYYTSFEQSLWGGKAAGPRVTLPSPDIDLHNADWPKRTPDVDLNLARATKGYETVDRDSHGRWTSGGDEGSVPSGEAIREAASSWLGQIDYDNPWGNVIIDAHSSMRGLLNAEEQPTDEHQQRLLEQGKTLLYAAAVAAPVDKPLYRGINVDEPTFREYAGATKGDTYRFNLSSWSSDPRSAVGYAFGQGSKEDPLPHAVVFQLQAGAHALSMADYAPAGMHWEQEFLSSGEFRVTGTKPSSGLTGITIGLTQIEPFTTPAQTRGTKADLPTITKYSEDQPRDERGRWSSSGYVAGDRVQVRPGARHAGGVGVIEDTTDHRGQHDPSGAYHVVVFPSQGHQGGQAGLYHHTELDPGDETTREAVRIRQSMGVGKAARRRIVSGGQRREAALQPLLAQVRAKLIHLSEEHKVRPVEKQGGASFLGEARDAIRRGLEQGFAEGWRDSGAKSTFDPADFADLIDAATDRQMEFLTGLQDEVEAGDVASDDELDARLEQYAEQVYPMYERGFREGTLDQGVIQQATWRTVGDKETCDLCDDRDGQVWLGDELNDMPLPGEGNFGEVCQGAMNCRCEVEYDVADSLTAAADPALTKDYTTVPRDERGRWTSGGGDYAASTARMASPMEMARAVTDKMIRDKAAELERLKDVPTDQLPRQGIYNPVALALWRERVGIRLGPEEKRELGLARNEPAYRAGTVRGFNAMYADTHPEAVTPETRQAVADATQRVLDDPQMRGIMERADMVTPPVLVVSSREQNWGTVGDTPQAEWIGDKNGRIVVYDGESPLGSGWSNTKGGEPLTNGTIVEGGWDATIRHELGHGYEENITDWDTPEGGPGRDRHIEWSALFRSYKDEFDAKTPDQWMSEKTHRYISFYSLTNEKEAFGETFSLVTSGKPYDKSTLTDSGRAMVEWMERQVAP